MHKISLWVEVIQGPGRYETDGDKKIIVTKKLDIKEDLGTSSIVSVD